MFKKLFGKKIKTNGNNQVLGETPTLNNSQIIFNGKNNILYCEGKTVLNNSKITFNGDNSIVYLKKGNYYISASIYNNSVLHFGQSNYFNPYGPPVSITVSEEKNVFIGNNNLFSHGTYIRTADPHLIYDKNTNKRINYSKSVYIGDHVWLGQNAAILKGTKIHSGTILGAESVIANKEIKSNAIFAGNPIKLIRNDIYWNGTSVHRWTNKETLENAENKNSNDTYTFKEDEYIAFNTIETTLQGNIPAEEKLAYLKNFSQNKNRFTLEIIE